MRLLNQNWKQSCGGSASSAPWGEQGAVFRDGPDEVSAARCCRLDRTKSRVPRGRTAQRIAGLYYLKIIVARAALYRQRLDRWL